jgi:hypothetical protein
VGIVVVLVVVLPAVGYVRLPERPIPAISKVPRGRICTRIRWPTERPVVSICVMLSGRVGREIAERLGGIRRGLAGSDTKSI